MACYVDVGFRPSSSDRAYSSLTSTPIFSVLLYNLYIEHHEVHYLDRFTQFFTELTSRRARTGSGYTDIFSWRICSTFNGDVSYSSGLFVVRMGQSSRMSMNNDGPGNNSFEIWFFFLLESCSHRYLAENERTNMDQPINLAVTIWG